jgi:hypothetical protein
VGIPLPKNVGRQRKSIRYCSIIIFFGTSTGPRPSRVLVTWRCATDTGLRVTPGTNTSTIKRNAGHFGVWHFSAPYPLTAFFGYTLTPKYTYIFKSCQVVGWYILSCLEVYSAPYPLTNREQECIGGHICRKMRGIYLYFPS